MNFKEPENKVTPCKGKKIKIHLSAPQFVSTGLGANFFPLTQTNLKDFGPLDLVQWFGSTPPVTGPFKARPFMEGVGITTTTRNSSGGRLIYPHQHGERTAYPKKTWLDPPNQPTPHPWFLWNLPVCPRPGAGILRWHLW